jgi:hypothetical protein
MRYVLPALPVSGPSGKRARRREAARLAPRGGKTQRQDAAGCCAASASRAFLALGVAVSLENAMLTNQQATELQPRVLHSSSWRPSSASDSG